MNNLHKAQKKWVGDFTINPGDGMALLIKTDFQWNIDHLVTPPYPDNHCNDP